MHTIFTHKRSKLNHIAKAYIEVLYKENKLVRNIAYGYTLDMNDIDRQLIPSFGSHKIA